jgi:glyoxylase-like metal-dependent hydrolase (beta-lactamase superfamily II)
VRATGLHADVVVANSCVWQTSCTLVRSGEEAFCIDSPVYPDELELLPAVAGQAGFTVVGLLATHVDWDHVLGRYAFPELALGVGDPTMERLRAEPGAVQRELRDEDARNYVVREGPLGLGSVQSLPVPGYLELGDQELELHPADGHTSDGTALLSRAYELLVCGDYLSSVEVPWLSPGGSLDDYRATLARLAPLVEAAQTVVPGHGPVHGRDTALRLLDEDLEYLDAVARGDERPTLPKGRDTARQREIHQENLALVG